MREYKFYRIKPDGHISGPATVHELPDDQSALKEAKIAAVKGDVEIWHGARIVAYVVAGDTQQTLPHRKPDADQHK